MTRPCGRSPPRHRPRCPRSARSAASARTNWPNTVSRSWIRCGSSQKEPAEARTSGDTARIPDGWRMRSVRRRRKHGCTALTGLTLTVEEPMSYAYDPELSAALAFFPVLDLNDLGVTRAGVGQFLAE